MFSISMLTTILLSISLNSAMAQNTTASGATGSASASSIASLAGSLSTSCQTSAGGLLSSEFGSCANVIGLASVIGATGSIVPPLNTWITSICSADPCSNSTLTSAKQTITSGCSADIQKSSPIALGLNAVIGNYGAVRNMLCTQYVSNSTFCVTSLLENVQAAAGQNLTLSTISTLFSNGLSGSAFSQVPPGALCNDCGHALVTLSAPLAAAAGNASMTPASSGNMTMTMPSNTTSAGGLCGASFNDGKVPSSVKIAAKGSSTPASAAANGAGVRVSASAAGILLVALASSILAFAC